MTQSAERLNDKNQKLFKDRLFDSGFDYTDIIKCDGDFFLPPEYSNTKSNQKHMGKEKRIAS